MQTTQVKTPHEYKLATDNAEMNRLGVQHRMWTLLLGGLFPRNVGAQVEAMMNSPKKALVLDVGCGSGIWAMEMAKTYPDAQVIGLDLKKQTYPNAPVNFKFIEGDVADLLSQFEGQADIIHCRCVAQHVKDPCRLVKSLADTLKPGGLLLLADGDFIVYDQSKQLVPPVTYDATTGQVATDGGRSWYAGWLSVVGTTTRSSLYRRIDELVNEFGETFEGSSVEFRSLFTPLNWAGDDINHSEELGNILNINQRAFLPASRGTLLKSGIPDPLVTEWAAHYEEELDNKHYYNIWYYITAQKSTGV